MPRKGLVPSSRSVLPRGKAADVRAAVCHTYGEPEVVTVEEVPSPSLGAGQVRIRVAAAAVNFPDVLLIADHYQLTMPIPFVPGSEFAGVVEEIGGGVRGVTVGDRVMGSSMVGGFAEEVVAGADGLLAIP